VYFADLIVHVVYDNFVHDEPKHNDVLLHYPQLRFELNVVLSDTAIQRSLGCCSQ
jgi:hypothetical protein